MLLYTCAVGKHGGSMPIVQHPCGRAAKALDDAGHTYDTKTVGGFKALGFTRRGKRDRIRELTGQEDVPVLVLNDGRVVTGHQAIVDWAREHPV